MKARIFYTKFWSDSYIASLTHKEMLAFIYLFANDLVGLSGVYELPDHRAIADLKVTPKEWEEIKVKFMHDQKFAFYKGWVKIANSERYQNFTGEKNEIAKEREISLIGKPILKTLEDTLSIGYQQPLDTLSNTYTVINNKKSEKGGAGGEVVGRDLNFSTEDIATFKEKFADVDVEGEIEAARDYLKAHAKKRYDDYHAMMRNWFRNPIRKNGRTGGVVYAK